MIFQAAQRVLLAKRKRLWYDECMELQLSDSHKSFKGLMAAGFTQKQAEAVIATIRDVDYSVIATKQDVSDLREVLKEDIQDLRAELKEDVSDLKLLVTEFKGDTDNRILGLEGRVNKKIDGLKIWFLTMMLTQTAVLVGIILALQNVGGGP